MYTLSLAGWGVAKSDVAPDVNPPRKPPRVVSPHRSSSLARPTPKRASGPSSRSTVSFQTDFDRSFFSLPRGHPSFNDDIHLECFRPPVLTFAGHQRKGIHEPLDSCRSFEDHVKSALKEDFPLSRSTPLPKNLRECSHFRS